MGDPKSTNNETYSCQKKSYSPLNQNCLSECLVYNIVVIHLQQKLNTELEKKVWKIGITITFHHLETSRHKSTNLSNDIQKLKVNDENYTIDWLIAMKARHYICGARESDLYLCENLLIARASIYRTNKTNTSKQLLVS